MAINLKSAAADRLARELAALTGESLTEAITVALDERLTRERRIRRRGRSRGTLERLAAEFRTLPVLDDRPADAILGYDADGLPS